ncbi:DUF6751 family protein [Clostridium sp. ZBS17]|uniref:DUF6751 family protein n=1 Tax=Clostridium sp. ZBS17 TaxID=2949968 RepID=UPI00207A5BDE|nr:DUF6751 family protein [Clostridium sp. ZBS17]
MKTNTIATLYNHYTDKETERTVYKRTVITSVNWQEKLKTTVTDKGLISANIISVFIPFNSDFEGKEYIGPKAYKRLSEEEKDKYFTFDNDDFIVKGEIDEFITIDTLKKSYDNVATIISTIICDKGSLAIRHYEVGAE